MSPPPAATMRRSIDQDRLAKTTDIERPFAGTGSLPVALQVLKSKTVAIAYDPQVQVIALSASGGAVALGAAGSACGMAVGSATGAAVGVVPAIFTFGLSIPISATVGGAVGTIGGGIVGSGMGIITGGAAGGITYKYRIEIQNGLVKIQTMAGSAISTTMMKAKSKGSDVQVQLLTYTNNSRDKASQVITYTHMQAKELLDKAWKKSLEMKTVGYELAMDRTTQITAASAVAGSVALGATGGVAGLATGGTVGAAVGVLPALFTFGLSIPICACIGATTGALAGVTAGGAVGAVGGGVVGNRLYVKQEDIKSGTFTAYKKANNYARFVKVKAQEFPSYMQRKMIGCTGATETED